MLEVKVQLLSKFEVQRNGQSIPGLEARRVQELLCYLLLYRNKPHSREILATRLWGENSTEKSKKYLRQALWQLQSALNPDDGTNKEGILILEREWVQLNPSARLWLDVAEFEQSIHVMQSIAGRELDNEQVKRLTEAIQLYKGDLLEGCYQDWCIFERERLQQLYLLTLDKLMLYCEEHGEYEQGLQYGSRILRVDRARERTHRRLMRLYALANDRTGALRQYERLCTTLHEELGVKPAKCSIALYRQIESDHMHQLKPDQEETSSEQVTNLFIINILKDLKQLRNFLFHLNREVQDRIETIENTIEDSH